MAEEEDEDYDNEEFRHADIPSSFRELRACMTCSLVKSFTQFYDHGCENCSFLQMSENRKRVSECTSAYFEGMIAMMQPRESWVAKWQRTVRLLPGVYAVTVTGELPEPVKQYLIDNNIQFRTK